MFIQKVTAQLCIYQSLSNCTSKKMNFISINYISFKLKKKMLSCSRERSNSASPRYHSGLHPFYVFFHPILLCCSLVLGYSWLTSSIATSQPVRKGRMWKWRVSDLFNGTDCSSCADLNLDMWFYTAGRSLQNIISDWVTCIHLNLRRFYY